MGSGLVPALGLVGALVAAGAASRRLRARDPVPGLAGHGAGSRQLRFPQGRRLYTGTRFRNLPGILAHGLKPGGGVPGAARTRSKGALFFTDDLRLALGYSQKRVRDIPVVIEVRGKRDDFEPDVDDVGIRLNRDIDELGRIVGRRSMSPGDRLSASERRGFKRWCEEQEELRDEGSRDGPLLLYVDGRGILCGDPWVANHVDNEETYWLEDRWEQLGAEYDGSYLARQYMTWRGISLAEVARIWVPEDKVPVDVRKSAPVKETSNPFIAVVPGTALGREEPWVGLEEEGEDLWSKDFTVRRRERGAIAGQVVALPLRMVGLTVAQARKVFA